MDGLHIGEWIDGARGCKELDENSERFRKIQLVRANMLKELGERINDSEKTEGFRNLKKVYHVMQSAMLESDEETCSICLLSISYEGVVTDCGHMFHYECEKEWCRRSRICAVCRQNVKMKGIGKKIGVQGLWLKFMSRLTIKERMQVLEPMIEQEQEQSK